MLTERKIKILQFIVDYYVATAEPVGSRTIAREFSLGLSPATIRNEMSDLELLGYLEQPHASAGRIPSSKGYRLYVDSLGEPAHIDEQTQEFINSWYQARIMKMDEVFQTTAKILSRMTNNLSLVTAYDDNVSKFHYIKFLPLDTMRAILLLVTSSGVVENSIVNLPQGVSFTDLDNISIRINNRLSGMSLSEITGEVIREAYADIINDGTICNSLHNLLKDLLHSQRSSKVYMGGTTQMLNQPEFNSVERVRELLQMIEEQHLLQDIISTANSDVGIQISIGSENKLSEIKDCSVVKVTYSASGRTLGSLAVLGPTRMEYAKIIAIMNYLEKYLHKLL